MHIHQIAVNKIYSHNQMLKLKRIIGTCCFFLCLVSFLFIPSLVFSYDSSPSDFKKFISALEQQSSLYGWTDIKPGAISWEYYRTTKNKHPLIFTSFGNSTGNCIYFLAAFTAMNCQQPTSCSSLPITLKIIRLCLKISALLSRRSSILTDF